VDIVLALTALYNFTRIRDGNIGDIYLDTDEDGVEDIQPTSIVPIEASEGQARGMDNLRDKIAEDMWKDYQRYINTD
jgi:hypothetical protein